MTLYLSAALPGLAWVAADNRVTTFGRERTHADAFTKICATPFGWVAGCLRPEVLEYLAAPLTVCRSMEEVQALLGVVREDLERLARVADDDHLDDGTRANLADPRKAIFDLVQPGEFARVNWRTGELERRGCAGAIRTPSDDAEDVLRAYRAAVAPYVHRAPDDDVLHAVVAATGRVFAGPAAAPTRRAAAAMPAELPEGTKDRIALARKVGLRALVERARRERS